MSESLYTDRDTRLPEDFTIEALGAATREEELLPAQRESLLQPIDRPEKLMATCLVTMRSLVEYAKENNELPFPHFGRKESVKAKNVVATAIDFLRNNKGVTLPEQPTNIPSVDQAIAAMGDVYGDPLEGVDDEETHPLVVFFNSLDGANKDGKETIDLASVSPEFYDSVEQFVGRWAELEDDRIMDIVRLDAKRPKLT